jgi:signal transduction histidine kinase/ActR/RegA family two-component response regulator
MIAWLAKGSLRRKLTMGTVVVIIAAQLAAAIVLIALERSRARQSLADGMQTSAHIVVDNVAAALMFEYHDEAEETLRALGVQAGFMHACLYDHNAQLFAAYLVSGSCSPSPSGDGAEFGRYLTVNTPIVRPERGRIGTLSLQSSLEPINSRMRDQIFGTLIVLLISSTAAVLFMAGIQRQLTAPLQELASTAGAVSRDRNYDRRVRKEADDEIGAVTEAFNDMLSQIKLREEELQNALRLKDEFLATVSHELRTPLNAMLGWSHVLRDPTITPPIMRQAVDAIDRNAQIQARLIEDILDVSRIITGKLRLDLKSTDLTAIVLSAVDVVKPSADARGITIHVDAPATAPLVGDSDRLRQVVWNILSNAVKFTPKGGRVDVVLSEEHAGEYRVEVTDTGRGIPPEFLPCIFQPFRQADGSSTRSHGGLGLGLAIARHLTELSGGSIQAASAGVGRGATFTIRLARHAAPMRPPVPEERATMTERWSDLNGHHVLVVDDNEDTRNVLATMLEAHGADVATAGSVAEARVALETRLPDVLVTDLAMPVEDGFGLLDYCRHHADPRLQALPILALTAYGGQQAHDRVIAAGFDAYLAKPVEPVEVGRVVRELALKNSSSAH